MVLAALMSLGVATGYAPASTIDAALAGRYFQEAKWVSEDDGGRLWGKPLYGPMIFVDPRTRAAVANEEPAGMGMKAEGGVYVGTLPHDVNVANTAFDYKGKAWSMVMWPLPQNQLERTRLVMHELWHRIQKDVGLPAESPSNAHLDTMNGRVWLRLEVRALEKAMAAAPDDRRSFEADALAFRAYRQSLFPSAKRDEDRMEVHEGMAEYTGWMLRGTYQPETRLALGYLKLRLFDNVASYPASFAYSTGAAYGLCLNIENENWRKSLSPTSSLADLLASAIGYHPSPNLRQDAEQRAARYGGPQVVAEESDRERQRAAKEATYRRLLIEGPVLDLPLTQSNYSYDPNALFPLGKEGTVFPETTVIDAWGKIVVSGGALMSADKRHLYVPAPSRPGDLTGEGWTIELNRGWKVVPGKRKGDFVAIRSQAPCR